MRTMNARDLGFDPTRLERVARAIEADVEADRYDGAAVAVGRRGAVALETIRGFADRKAGKRLAEDSVFVSMSIGKQFTNVLVLDRIERGALSLTMPVAELIPEFACRGKDRINVFQLLTHTSGLVSAIPAIPPEDLASIERLTAFACASLPESLPGERVNYSILVAHAVLAELVRRAEGSRRSFTRILEEDLFGPLGMKNTSLGPRDDLLARLSPVLARYDEPGLFDPAGVPGLGELICVPGAEIPAGGYLTTIGDLHRFAEMLRGGGELDGVRILSPAMLAFATRNHTGDRPNRLLDYTVSMRGWDPFPASIGLGFFVRGDGVIPGPFGNLSSPRTFGGWGAGSSAFWIDPEHDLTFSFLSTGLMEDSRHLDRLGRLSDMVVASVVD